MADWRMTYIEAVQSEFAWQHTMAERALAQIGDEELFRTTGVEDNSIAVLMKHVGGNLRSRWTEPFTTDGEKPDRQRDIEFVVVGDDAVSVRGVWDRGWGVLMETLNGLRVADLEREIVIRGEAHTLIRSLERSLAHTSQHVGQIIMLAKQWRGGEWQTLTIPRGESEKYLRKAPA